MGATKVHRTLAVRPNSDGSHLTAAGNMNIDMKNLKILLVRGIKVKVSSGNYSHYVTTSLKVGVGVRVVGCEG